jgi:hypothetical protein
MKLMTLKLQGPSLAQAPSKALRGVLEIPRNALKILQIMYERYFKEVFPKLTTTLKI